MSIHIFPNEVKHLQALYSLGLRPRDFLADHAFGVVPGSVAI